jgi:ribosomal protein S6 kinase alpha-5
MELVKGGRLTDLIRDRFKSRSRFSDKEASAMIKAILSAVSYMHEKGIVHRDLKPGKHQVILNQVDNILVHDT